VPRRGWIFRVQDMVDCAEKILEYTRGQSLDQFRSSPIVVDAVFYNITILGEAARHVPDEVVARHPEIEWAAVRGMRNNLVHEYFGADMQIVWATIQTDIPELIPKLKAVLAVED
jgi:uncharacterized protein with HEPN domain